MEIFFILLLILEIVFFLIGKIKKKIQFISVSNGIAIGLFISLFLYGYFFTSDTYNYGAGGWAGFEYVLAFLFFGSLNFIVFVVSLSLQKKIKDNTNLFKNKTTLLCIVLIVSVSFIFIHSQYKIKYNEKKVIDNEVSPATLKYLENKYGSREFKINDIDSEFAANGFIETDHLENYFIQVEYIPDNIEFFVTLEVDDKRNILINSSTDTLSKQYFDMYFENEDIFQKECEKIEKKLSQYLKSKQFNVEVSLSDYGYEYSTREEAVPRNFGKIPSKEELYNLVLDYYNSHEFNIKINENEIKNDDITLLELELKEYLIRLTNCLIDYYGEDYTFEVEYEYFGGVGNYFTDVIKVDKESINIPLKTINLNIKR